MNIRQIKRELEKEYIIKKRSSRYYDFIIILNDKEYIVKFLNIKINTLITINSIDIWNLKIGKADGIRFKSSSSNLLNLGEFMKQENKIILLKNKPYKILQHINESDIIDISNSIKNDSTYIISNLQELKNIE